jgi:hypothetical protein
MITTPIDPLEMIWITLLETCTSSMCAWTDLSFHPFEQGQLIADGQCEDNATSEL